MNNILLQLWEESLGDNTRPDGCSLHLDIDNRENYIKSFYERRKVNIPKQYERAVSAPIEVTINDKLFNILLKSETIRLSEHEFSNLVELKDIKIKNE